MNFASHVVGNHLDLRGVSYLEYIELGEFLKSKEVSVMVRTISFSPELISSDDFGNIFSALNVDYLESINLAIEEDVDQGISDCDLGELFSSFRQWKSILSINLRGNSSVSMLSIVKLLKFKNASLLTSLDISSIDAVGASGNSSIFSSLRFLKNLSNLYLRGSLTKEGSLKALTDSRCIEQLTHLDLSSNGISDQDLIYLVNSGHTKKLTYLYLSGNKIGDKGLKGLAKSQHLKELTNLDVSNNDIVFSDVNSLHNNNLTSLVSINLSHNSESTRNSLTPCLLSVDFKNITSLNLAFSFLITANGIRDLFHHHKLENLDFLDLSGNSIKDEVMEALAHSKFEKLKQLHLNTCLITDKDLAVLGDSNWIKNVSHLALGDNRLTLSAFNKLIECEGFKGLTSLDLNGISSRGVEDGITQGNIGNITSLILTNSRINDDLLKTLVDAFNLRGLVFIGLAGTHVSFSCIKDLIKSHFKSLLSLDLSFQNFTIEEMHSSVDSLSEVITKRLTVTFTDGIVGKNVTKFRTIIPEPGGRSINDDLIIGYRTSRESCHFFETEEDVHTTFEDQLTPAGFSGAKTINKSDLIPSNHHSKNATTLPSIIIDESQNILLDHGLKATFKTPQVASNYHLQVKNTGRSKKGNIYSSSRNTRINFVNRKDLDRYFVSSGIDTHKRLLEWMRSSYLSSSSVSDVKDRIGLGLEASILDVNCLDSLINQNSGFLVELALPNCHISDKGAEFLAKNLPLTLTTVNIKDSNVTYIGVSYLFKSGLSYIDASNCGRIFTSDTSTQISPLPSPSREKTNERSISERVAFPRNSRFIFKNMAMPGGKFKEYFLCANIDYQGIVQLDLQKNSINSDDLFALSKKNVSTIERLDLSGNTLNDECAVALKNCKFSDSIELNLGYNNIDNSGLKSLLEADFFKNLTKLRINNNKFDHNGWKNLEGLVFHNLRFLNLSENRIGPLGAALIASHGYPDLEKLYLSSADLGDQGVASLVKNSFPSLTSAILNSNGITDVGAVSLASVMWPKLVKLSLDGNRIDAKGVSALADRSVQKLETLYLGVMRDIPPRYMANLFSSGLKFLHIKAIRSEHSAVSSLANIEADEEFMSVDNSQEVAFPQDSSFSCIDTCMSGGSFEKYFLHNRINCKGIVYLDLSGNVLSKDDICALQTANMTRITTLILRNTNINDESLEKLSSINFIKIRKIDLSNNSISGEGALKALSNGSWKKTGKFYLRNNENISADHKSQLKDLFGNYVIFDLECNESDGLFYGLSDSLSDASSYASSYASSDASSDASSYPVSYPVSCESSCDSDVWRPINLRTSSPNPVDSLVGFSRHRTSFTHNSSSFCVPIPENSSSEILESVANSGKKDTSVSSDNLRINEDSSSINSIYSAAEHAHTANENLPLSTSHVTKKDPVSNSTPLSNKRVRSPNTSPSMERKLLKVDESHKFISTREEEEISEISGSSDFRSPQSNLKDPHASNIFGLSKGKDGS